MRIQVSSGGRAGREQDREGEEGKQRVILSEVPVEARSPGELLRVNSPQEFVPDPSQAAGLSDAHAWQSLASSPPGSLQPQARVCPLHYGQSSVRSREGRKNTQNCPEGHTETVKGMKHLSLAAECCGFCWRRLGWELITVN